MFTHECILRNVGETKMHVILELTKRGYSPMYMNFENNVGGTTLHCKDIISSLRNKYNFFVLAPEKLTYVLYSYFEYTEKRIELSIAKNICIPCTAPLPRRR